VDCGNVNLWRAVRAARVVRGFVSSIQLRLAVAVVCQGSRRSWDLRMKPRQLELLRKIAEAPRTLHNLTHAANGVADIQLSPHVLTAYLDDLVLHDLISPPAKQHSFFRVTQEGLDYLASLPQITPSKTLCNASMPSGSYKPREWNIRTGGNDHEMYRSRGIGA
jgi:hypothetical protein